MTDGPFKNLKLDRWWKLFAEAVQNDAVVKHERHSLASHALVNEILCDENKALLKDLLRYVKREQLDLDPEQLVENIFNEHSKTTFSDTCQKELVYRLSEGVPLTSALRLAIEATVVDQINMAMNRIEEECIHARDSGEMSEHQFRKTVTQARTTFESLASDEICDALYEGDKNAFKEAVSKKDGIDDGPNL